MDPLCPKCRHAVPAPKDGYAGYRCDNCGHRWKADIGPPTTPQGTPTTPPPTSPPAGASEGWAVASLVCGLVFFIPLVTQILAFVFGVVAFRRIEAGEGRASPRIMAATGMGCALLAVMMWIWVGVFYMQAIRPMPAAATPAPAGTASAPAALVRLGYSAGYAGVSPSSQIPSGQVTDAELKAKELLRGLVMYRQDFRRWPKTFDDLIPTYLGRNALRLDKIDAFGREVNSAKSDEKLFNYVSPTPNSTTSERKQILVYSMRFDFDDKGEKLEGAKRWVIWSNNVIEFVDEKSVADALNMKVEELPIAP